MIRRGLFVVLLMVAATATLFAEVRGSWSAEKNKDGRIQLSLRLTPNSHSSFPVSLSDFEGLTAGQMASATSTPVTFRMTREAGNINFTGNFEDNEGDGRFTFNANPAYVSSMRSLGVDVDSDTKEKELFHAALFNVSTQFVRELNSFGYRDFDLDDLIGLRIHRVSGDLIRAYAQAGYKNLSLDKLMAMSIHRVTPEYIREMGSIGYPNLDEDDLIAMKIHRVTPEFVREMKASGYTNLDADDLVAMRIHRVDPEFVRELRNLGYTNVDKDDLVAMKIHRVSSEFVRELKSLGYSNVDPDDLVAMSIHRVTPEFIREANSDGVKHSIDDLVEMKIVGKHARKRAKVH